MSVNKIIDEALRQARAAAGGGTDKTASAEGAVVDLVKEAHQVADALEFMAGAVVDDGTAEGNATRSVISDFFKRADALRIVQTGLAKGDHPPESISPTGVQAVPPQSGAKKILPTGLKGGNHPEELVAPTGTQPTIGQEKRGEGAPMTILDMLTKRADGVVSPVQSTALHDVADPGKRNENSNVDRILGSNQSVVNATKRDAKAPTLARLKTLFTSASDTGPSLAAAKAAFPTAYARGGMKVADAEEASVDTSEDARREAEARRVAAYGSLFGPFSGLGASKGRKLTTAVGSAAGGLLGGGIAGAIHPALGLPLGMAGNAAGAYIGHGLGHGNIEKGASLNEYAALFDKAASGELGPEAKAFAEYIEGVQV